MAPTLRVKASDDAIRTQRRTVAERVLAHFGNRLPDLRLLCFFDDDDWQPFKDYFGEANRGFYGPIKDNSFSWPTWPEYVMECILVDDGSGPFRRAFDHVIYLYGSTCANEVGLAMAFAHELQHFVQHSDVLKLWAANSLIQHLPKSVINALGLKWSDIPIEREARIVSKRTAENLFGAETVRQYVVSKIAGGVSADDAADWMFVLELVTSAPFDVARETQVIFQRVKASRSNLEELAQELKNDPDFKDLDLRTLLDGASP